MILYWLACTDLVLQVLHHGSLRVKSSLFTFERKVSPLLLLPTGCGVSGHLLWRMNVSDPSFADFLVGFFSSKIAADIGPLILLIFAGVLAGGCVYIYFLYAKPPSLGIGILLIARSTASSNRAVSPWKKSTRHTAFTSLLGSPPRGSLPAGSKPPDEKAQSTKREKSFTPRRFRGRSEVVAVWHTRCRV